MPFQHEIIDLKRKPAEFLELSPTGLVPLLQLEDGSVVTESVPVARRIATALDKSGRLMPGEAASRIDSFCQHWTAKVEPAYYDILRAGSEPQVHVATAAFVSTLSQVEKRLQGAATDAAAPAAFLLGDDFSLAEAIAAPWVERMLLMLPYWRGIDAVALCEQHACPRTAQWLQAVAARPSVQQTSAGEAEMARAAKLYYVDYASPDTRGEVVLEIAALLRASRADSGA